MKIIHLHLVSDSTGETASSVAKAAMAQFEGVEIEEHVWPLIRTKGQLDRVVEEIRKNPGFVMCTIADYKLERYLKETCNEIGVPCVSILSRIIGSLSSFLGVKASHQIGKQHELDEDYFTRMEAVNFALAHDDGQSAWDLEDADIVLVGVSRTSKSPTSMYLAHKGYRSANIPFVPGTEIPGGLDTLKGPMIVGLTVNPEILVQIRKNRMLSINNEVENPYTDKEIVMQELAEARQLFTRNNWPIIDVSRRSVEETAATIIQLYVKFKEGRNKS